MKYNKFGLKNTLTLQKLLIVVQIAKWEFQITNVSMSLSKKTYLQN